MESVLKDMRNKEFNDQVKQKFNMNLYKNDPVTLPETEEELGLHMQLTSSNNRTSLEEHV